MPLKWPEVFCTKVALTFYTISPSLKKKPYFKRFGMKLLDGLKGKIMHMRIRSCRDINNLIMEGMRFQLNCHPKLSIGFSKEFYLESRVKQKYNNKKA